MLATAAQKGSSHSLAAGTLAFEEAVRATGELTVRDYCIGGDVVRVKFAGQALRDCIVPAMAHREIENGIFEPRLTISVWDRASSGVPMPELCHDETPCESRREVRSFQSGLVSTAYNLHVGTFSQFDCESGEALYWVRDARRFPWYECGAPLLTILHWWFNRRGKQVVHGAVVGRPRGGVLLAGRGGSGKSTTALTCLDAGFHYVADDYCLLDMTPEPYASSIYCTGKLDDTGLLRLPRFAPYIHNQTRGDDEKALVFLHPAFQHLLASGLPLRAVLIPRVTKSNHSKVRPATAAEALRAIAPSTIFQLSGANESSFHRMASLVRQVPCLHLELGSDPASLPQMIDQVISSN